MNIIIYLPCYNEEANITALIGAWNSLPAVLYGRGYTLRVYGIDDCSRDATKQKIMDMANEYDNVFLLAHEVNKGLRGGLNTAVRHFTETGRPGDLMVLMDGDNTHDPKYILAMLDELSRGRDCVIASRYAGEARVVGVAAHRRFLSDMARHYYRLMLRVPGVRDYTCGYRVYTYEIIKKLVDKYGAEPVENNTFACMMELLYKLYLCGARFGEAGFTLRYDNKKGASKMRVAKTMLNSLTAAFHLRKQRKRGEAFNAKC